MVASNLKLVIPSKAAVKLESFFWWRYSEALHRLQLPRLSRFASNGLPVMDLQELICSLICVEQPNRISTGLVLQNGPFLWDSSSSPSVVV